MWGGRKGTYLRQRQVLLGDLRKACGQPLLEGQRLVDLLCRGTVGCGRTWWNHHLGTAWARARVWDSKAGQGRAGQGKGKGKGKGSDRRSDSQQLTSRTDQQTRVRA